MGRIGRRMNSANASKSTSPRKENPALCTVQQDKPKHKQGKWTMGHTLALSILVGGSLTTLFMETLKVYREAGGTFSREPAIVFCPVPPRFDASDEDVFGPLRKYPNFDVNIPMVEKYARLIHSYLEQWEPIKGVTEGYGSRGMISAEALRGLAREPAVMSCDGHIRVVGGKVYLRYGGFWHIYYRLHRFLQTAKMIQDAVNHFGLHDLQLELFVNTCDMPQSFFSNLIPGRSGYPIMSTGFTVDTADIPVPDPLDLTESYTPDLSKQIPWDQKTTRAVFRGKTTNFEMLDGNWGANPRVRLHRISDVPENKDLMDAHINSWSHASEATQKKMKQDGLHLAQAMVFSQFNAFKYQIIVDGGGGSCRTCGVLRSNQMSIRQRTPLYQFYEPLLEDDVHWLVVQRSFSDLPETIRWAQKHDEDAQKISLAANEFSRWACTVRGRTLYWALMLVKYQQAIMVKESIQAPASICKDKATIEAPVNAPNPALVRCDAKDKDKKQTGICTFFCASGIIPEDHYVWLNVETHLKNYQPVGPP